MKKKLSLVLVLTFVLSLSIGMTSFAKTYVDGSYKATYDFLDGHGWKPTLTVTIKGDKITAAVYDAVNAAGKLKSKDAGYNKAMLAVNKTSPSIYSLALAKAFVKGQAVAKVNVVSGATTSSNEFKALATAALANAKKGVKKVAILKMNDTYTAQEAAFDSRGWKGQVALTYNNGKLVKVDFDYLDKDGKRKSENAEYNKAMKDGVGISAKEAIDKLAANYLTKKSVDVVSKATTTSDQFKTLVAQAAAMRK